jgi:small subunit ribosomal protein S18
MNEENNNTNLDNKDNDELKKDPPAEDKTATNDGDNKAQPREEKKKSFESRPPRGGDSKSPVQRVPTFKRKSCRFCFHRDLKIDYKNVEILERFVTERGKILPRRITGTCSKHQRALSNAIKKARILALLPFVVK